MIVSRSMKLIWAVVVAGIVVVLLVGAVLAQTLVTGTVTRNANLRAGPGTSYAVVGTAAAGAAVVIVGENAAGDWYELEDGQWIAAFLVTTGDAAPPVATTRPTAVATERPTAAVSNRDWLLYSAQINEIVPNMGSALEHMSTLMQAPRLTSDDWVIDLALQFVIIRQAHEQLVAMDPPASLASVHQQVLSATQDCNDATYAIADGLDRFDADELERGSGLLADCADKTVGLTERLRQVQLSLTPTPRQRATAVATWTPTATARMPATTAAAFASGGLGQDRAWWEKLYGAGEPALLGQMFNRFEVMFAENRARHIERQHAVAMPFVGAQREIRELLPADAEFVELTMPADRPGTWIELYRSPSLAERFVGAVWPNAEPGDFIVIYNLEDDQKASRVIVATGNDP